jgi:hypothetical protein
LIANKAGIRAATHKLALARAADESLVSGDLPNIGAPGRSSTHSTSGSSAAEGGGSSTCTARTADISAEGSLPKCTTGRRLRLRENRKGQDGTRRRTSHQSNTHRKPSLWGKFRVTKHSDITI